MKYNKIAWITDLHIDHCRKETQDKFFAKLAKANPDLVLISGDITQANYMERDFDLLCTNIKQTTLFCLGNHDFYYSSIAKTKDVARKVCEKYKHFRFVDDQLIFPVSQSTAVIGHSGFYDSRFGYDDGTFQMSDFQIIEDLQYIYRIPKLFTKKLNDLGDESAQYFTDMIPRAFDTGVQELIIVTHVPPFREAALYMGKPSQPYAMPFFSCKALGDVLLKEMQKRPDKNLTVYCGHTHDRAEVDVLPNLKIKAGAATYGSPRFELFEKL